MYKSSRLCLYICVYIYIHIFNLRTYTYIHSYTYIYIYTHGYLCHTYIYLYMYIYIHVYTKLATLADNGATRTKEHKVQRTKVQKKTPVAPRRRDLLGGISLMNHLF